ncbi:MAG TPA: 23S rRNA (pseudouridine(1915)-N(3))-methyltransferase RlmH [Syntrophomonadaceae bacterium]|nr:23S rRNA (pseudouridine(1915)-N(3))-methyltransferase RlmH [Syntrophomonadaceae bacterium]
MKYYIYSVGKIREEFYLQGIKEYLKRLNAYISIELIDGLGEKISPTANNKEIEKAINKEGLKILKNISPSDLVILLDVEGKKLDSPSFADMLANYNLSGSKRVIFIIGSSHGVSLEVKNRADQIISFSPLTFPHQMAVLILAEQIYRGFKILKNEPYHK